MFFKIFERDRFSRFDLEQTDMYKNTQNNQTKRQTCTKTPKKNQINKQTFTKTPKKPNKQSDMHKKTKQRDRHVQKHQKTK